MNQYINIYYAYLPDDINNGKTDGDCLSDGNLSNALTAKLNASEEEYAIFKCAVRTQNGFQTSGAVYLSFSGSNAEKWFFAKDDNFGSKISADKYGDWQSSLTLEDKINDTNTVFWVKVTSTKDETIRIDTSANILLKTVIESVE